MRWPQKSTRLNGFTLIEILIVLGVISILSAVLFAVFVRVRERGRSSVCQSNLKQIASAFQQYLQDNDGRFPAIEYVLNRDTPAAKVVYWNDVLSPYLKSDAVFFCPSSQLREPKEVTYGYNWRQLNSVVRRPNKPVQFNQLVGEHETHLSTVTMMVLNSDSWARYSDGVIGNGETIPTSCGVQIAATLHSGGANVSYIDGHIQWLSAMQQGETLCAP